MAEIICDGVHVHSPMIQVALAAKGPSRIMAITDGTAASGLATGAVASLGGRRICIRDGAAHLDDGTLAGSVATMDRVFRFLVQHVVRDPELVHQQRGERRHDEDTRDCKQNPIKT